MEILILVSSLLSDVTGEYVDAYNTRSEIVEFAYKTVNVVPNQSRQPLLKPGHGDPFKEPVRLKQASSTVGVV